MSADGKAADQGGDPYAEVALLLEAAPLPLHVIGMPTGDHDMASRQSDRQGGVSAAAGARTHGQHRGTARLAGRSDLTDAAILSIEYSTVHRHLQMLYGTQLLASRSGTRSSTYIILCIVYRNTSVTCVGRNHQQFMQGAIQY